jgi:acylphosphatase
VFFRDSTRRRAQAAGVAGWVANRPDGTVEAHFEGAPEDVEVLVDYARRGPRGAGVTRVDVRDVPPAGLSGFEVR